MAKASDTSKAGEIGTYRDTIESIWVAIILAFVLRAFVIEAFVIPTGSMAPRLLGEHWDVRCPSCGYEFAFGNNNDATGPKSPGCPSCRFPCPPNSMQDVSSGDRVLVLKYLYQFTEPRPWDVVVFKNPQDNRQNYIKRLVGLPGECLQIVHGDLFVAVDPNSVLDPNGGSDPNWTIRRKGGVQDVMWQIVYDNDYRPRSEWQADPRCPRWTPDDNADRWDANALEGRVLAWKGGPEPQAVRFGVSPKALRLDSKLNNVLFHPNYGYNSPSHFGNDDICTDLRLSCVLRPGDSNGAVTLKLSSFNLEFEGTVRSDGNVSLYIKGLPEMHELTKSRTLAPLSPGEGHTIALTNVDLQQTLWVDNEPVLQISDEDYGVNFKWVTARVNSVPAPSVSIEASGGALELWHVRLERDEFYTQTTQNPASDPTDPSKAVFRTSLGNYARDVEANAPAGDIRHRPAGPGKPGWGTFGTPIYLLKDAANPDLDEFFMLGDNSPSSLDGRSWVLAAPSLRLYNDGKFQYQLGTVPRYNLIGRALFVYWPSGFRIPGLRGLPIIPNVGRMRLIR